MSPKKILGNTTTLFGQAPAVGIKKTTEEMIESIAAEEFEKKKDNPKIDLRKDMVEVMAGTNRTGIVHDNTKDVKEGGDKILPKYVAFEGHNGKYLEPWEKYLKFSSSNTKDPDVVFEIIPNINGYVRIRHVESGKYWIRDPNWIHLRSIDTEKDDPNALFRPMKVDNKKIVLRNKGNYNFCMMLTTEGKSNCLNAGAPTLFESRALLEVVQIV